MVLDEYIEFTNAAGVTVQFNGIHYGLVSVEGLGDVDAEIQQQSAPYQDGSSFIDAILTPRNVDTEFIVRGADYAQVRERRAELARIVNPKLGLGILRYVSGGTVREINAVAESAPYFPDGDNRGARWQRGTLTFICPDPYWKSLGILAEPMFVPLFQFPFEGPFEMGIQQEQRVIYYEGDAPAPLQIEFFGPALNPKIINNSTGEFIRINQQLREGERMIIDTSDGSKSVYFVDDDGNERNVFNWIDLASSFFKLHPGQNDIEYAADSDIQGAIMNIRYNVLYTAV